MLLKKNKYIIYLILMVGLLYLPSLFNGFVNWDDEAHLLKNIALQSVSLDNIQEIFTTTVNKIYIPLTSLSFAIEHQFFGLNPFVYHFSNLLLHLFVTVSVMIFAVQCGLSIRAAFIAALIFGAHPMHVEAVAWVTARKDVLYAALYMAALVVYCRHLKSILDSDHSSKPKSNFAWVVVLGTLSALAKPMALSLPLILLLCDWYFGRKWSKQIIIEKIYVGIFIAPVIFVTYFLHAQVVATKSSRSIFIWFWCKAYYLRKFFMPDYFTLHYQSPELTSFGGPAFLASAIFVTTLLGVVIYFRKFRLLVFAYLFFFLSIFYVLRLGGVRREFLVLDRYMYLASVGWCMLIGYAVNWVLDKASSIRIRKVLYIYVGLGFYWLALTTINQIVVWKDGVSLWSHQLVMEPSAIPSLSYSKLGQAYFTDKNFNLNDEKQNKRIAGLFHRAIDINPNNYNAYWGLGELYKKVGDHDSARFYLEKAIEIRPDHLEASFSLVELNFNEKNWQKSIEEFCDVMAITKDNTRLLKKIERFYFDKVNFPEQWEYFKETCHVAAQRSSR